MNRKRIAIAVLSSVLALGFVAPAAVAQDRGDRHGWDRDHDRRNDRRDHRDRRDDRRGDRREWHDDRRNDRQVYRGGYQQGYRDARSRDYGYRPAPPPHRWSRGQRYHDYYRGPVYVVNDYPRYHVRRPPRGYHWVRDDRGNLLMVALATGIIADLVLNH